MSFAPGKMRAMAKGPLLLLFTYFLIIENLILEMIKNIYQGCV